MKNTYLLISNLYIALSFLSTDTTVSLVMCLVGISWVFAFLAIKE